jgi:hypothetical protein
MTFLHLARIPVDYACRPLLECGAEESAIYYSRSWYQELDVRKSRVSPGPHDMNSVPIRLALR